MYTLGMYVHIRIVKDGLEDAIASKLYVTSVYWTVTTLSTVGYGDIFASTIAERTYCILVSVGGFGLGVTPCKDSALFLFELLSWGELSTAVYDTTVDKGHYCCVIRR